MNGPVILLKKGTLVHNGIIGTNFVTWCIFSQGFCVIIKRAAYLDDDNLEKEVKVLDLGILIMKGISFFVFTNLLFMYIYPHLCPSKFSTYFTWCPWVLGVPHIWWIQVSRECYWKPLLLHSIVSMMIRRSLIQDISIKHMIHYRKIKTRRYQSRYWIQNGRICISGSTSGNLP